MGEVRGPHMNIHGRNVDDLSRAPFDHLGRHRSRAVKRALQVDVEHFIPLLIRHLNEGGAGIDSRVVDQNVDAPEFGLGAIDGVLYALDVSHVAGDGEGPPPCGADGSSHPFRA